MKLIPKQENAVYYLKDKVTKEIIYGGAAGGGKSALGCLWLIEQCQNYPGTRWLMGRSKLKNLKETTLNTFFELSSILQISNQYNYNAQEHIIYWNNGSEILLKDLFLYPSDPQFDKLGSLEITGAFVDECNQIVFKAWQIVTSRCRYKLKEYNLIPKIFGTCNPAKNWVYSVFYKPNKDKTIPEFRKLIQSLPTDNPHLPQSYLESLLKLDNNSKQRLYYGNWEYDDDPSSLISFNKIQDLYTNSFVNEGEKYISADIARFGSDSSVIGIWNGFILEEIVTLSKNKVTEAAEKILLLAKKYQVPNSNIIVDEDGVGGGVVDILKCNGFVNNSSPLKNTETFEVENFNNLKSQCYYKLAELVNSSKIYIKDTVYKDLINEELEQVKQYNMDKDTKKQILPKDKVKELIGRSPDFSDMIMMRCWFEYGRHQKNDLEFFVG